MHLRWQLLLLILLFTSLFTFKIVKANEEKEGGFGDIAGMVLGGAAAGLMGSSLSKMSGSSPTTGTPASLAAQNQGCCRLCSSPFYAIRPSDSEMTAAHKPPPPPVTPVFLETNQRDKESTTTLDKVSVGGKPTIPTTPLSKASTATDALGNPCCAICKEAPVNLVYPDMLHLDEDKPDFMSQTNPITNAKKSISAYPCCSLCAPGCGPQKASKVSKATVLVDLHQKLRHQQHKIQKLKSNQKQQVLASDSKIAQQDTMQIEAHGQMNLEKVDTKMTTETSTEVRNLAAKLRNQKGFGDSLKKGLASVTSAVASVTSAVASVAESIAGSSIGAGLAGMALGAALGASMSYIPPIQTVDTTPLTAPNNFDNSISHDFDPPSELSDECAKSAGCCSPCSGRVFY